MKSSVTIRCIPGATTYALKHHLKRCLEDSSPDGIIHHHGTNNLKSDDNSEKITSNNVNLGLSVKNEKIMVYISSLVIGNDKLDKKRKEVIILLNSKALPNTCFCIDNENINLGMLNKSGLHLKPFMHNVVKWPNIL